MAFSGALHDSDSQVILANTSLEDSKYVKNLDFVVNWVNPGLNIPDEVWRGKKLREEKPKLDKMERECFVSDIDFYKSFVKQPRERKRHRTSKKNTRLTSISQSKCCTRPTFAASSYLSTNRVSKTNTTQTVPKSKTKKRKRCPMRIAELAVPTKRQCMETWRNKSEILPVHMVERLKRHVMDQTLIANVTDAIYCFKTGRHQSTKKCSLRRLSSKPKCNENLKPRRCMEKKILCVIFAHRVANILSRQLNITLNSNLQKISDIVSSDIAKLMSKCQCTFNKDHQRYKAIHTEVSDAITVWITGILEDLSEKLLEEELRAKKEIEAQIETMQEFSEQFSAIIDTITKRENNNIASEELEEEEGPVLDFIDDVVENVMSICEPPVLYNSDSNISGSTQNELLGEESEKPPESIQSDRGGETDDSLTDKHENWTDSDHFRNEIIDIIKNISKESEDGRSNESGDDTEIEGISRVLEKERDINNEYNEEGSAEADKEHDINEVDSVKAYVQNDINDDENEVDSDKADKEQNEVDPTKTDKELYINEADSAYSDKKHDINEVNSADADIEHDVNEVDSANADIKHDINEVDSANADIEQDIKEVEPEKTDKENDTDEKDSANAENEHANENEDNNDFHEDTRSNVSEIFTDGIDDGNHDKKVIIPKADMVNPDIPAEQIGMSTTKKSVPGAHKQTQWNSRTNKPSIIFSEPNRDLLSDADESWPNDLIDKPPIKPSTIASKSVTSLGRIIEYEEKRTWSEDQHDMPKKAGGDKILQENDTMKIDLPTEKYDTVSQSNEPLIKESMETDLPTENHDTVSQSNKPLLKESIATDLSTEKHDIVSQSNKPLIKESIETSTTDGSFPKSDSKSPKETDIDKTKTAKFKEPQTESEGSEYRQTESSVDRTDDDEISRQKSKSLSVDYGWKVQPKTAPSWVTSSTWGQDRGEPSEDSIPIQIMPTLVKESELRKWCKNLQDGFSNLDMWSSWISATCKETLFLLKQKEWPCGVSVHKQAINWNKLRRNIRKDALLWTKLYQRTNANFKSYKGKYGKIELSAEKSMPILNKSYLDTILEFEDFSMKLHKMIVAAEYCVTCNCIDSKTNHLNKKYCCTVK